MNVSSHHGLPRRRHRRLWGMPYCRVGGLILHGNPLHLSTFIQPGFQSGIDLRNHEHIALLGLCLSSPSAEAHKIARHLADYVLVWAGGGGKDDVGKSKHMARIANSVYPGHCNEQDCDHYGVFPGGKPTKMMEESLKLGTNSLQIVVKHCSSFQIFQQT